MFGVDFQRKSSLLLGGLILTLCAAAGCGGPGLATVEGKVMVDGLPVGGGRVTFRSADGKSTVLAKIAPDGSYRALDVPQMALQVTLAELSKFERISIQRGVKGKRSSDSQARSNAIETSPKIPEKYQDPDASGLTLTVKSGTNTYDINISTK